MPRFFNSRDIDFIKTISEEVVNELVEQWVTLYKVSVGETKTNLYGESLGKIYHRPTNLMCIVERDDFGVQYDGFGSDTTNTIEFRFNREKLRVDYNLPVIRDVDGTEVPSDFIQTTKVGYPEIGDIVRFDGSYYEIDNTREGKLLAGAQTIYDREDEEFEDTRMELIATAVLVRKSQVQIEERVR